MEMEWNALVQTTVWCTLGLVALLDKLLCMVVDHKMIAKHLCGLVMKKRNILLGHGNSIPVAVVVWEQDKIVRKGSVLGLLT